MTWSATADNPPVVLLAADPTEQRFLARNELSAYLQRVLGMPRGQSEAPADAPRIELRVESVSGMSDEGYQWRIVTDGLVISGGGELGLLFGVYAFLREVCGCSFAGLGPDSEDVPQRQRIVVERAIAAREPILWYRGAQFSSLQKPEQICWHLDWMVKNGLNYVMYMLAPDEMMVARELPVDPHTGEPLLEFGQRSPRMREAWCERYLLSEARKRALKLDMNHHNLSYWLPPGRYFTDHPQWYAEIDGERGRKFTQLSICTSNQNAVAVLTENVLAYLRSHPDVKIVGVIPEDDQGMCQCAACVRADPNPQDAFGNWGKQDNRTTAYKNQSIANRYAGLLNHVARAVRREFPDVLVGGAAYVDLQWPPDGIELEDNIVIWVALYWRDGGHALSSGHKPYNGFYHDLLRLWRERHRGKLIVYEYYMGMNAQRSLPYPMSNVIAADWAEFRRLGIAGATIQCSTSVFQAYALNMLTFARCGWQQTIDADGLLDEFLRGMFGAAAAAIRPIYVGFSEAMAQLNVAQPKADNIGRLVKHVGVETIERAQDLAAQSAATPRERRQVDIFARYMRYCLLAARHGEDVQTYLQQTPMVGWFAPDHIRAWRPSRQVAKEQSA